MANILIITSIPTHPQQRGNSVRLFQLAKCLREYKHDVHILFCLGTPASSDPNASELAEMSKFWGADRLHIYKAPFAIHDAKNSFSFVRRAANSLVRRLKEFVRGIFPSYYGHLAHRVDSWYPIGLDPEIKMLHARYQFAIAIAAYVYMSKSLLCFNSSTIRIVDTYDAFGKWTEDFFRFRTTSLACWFAITRYQEKMGLERASVVIGIKEDDCNYYRKLTNVNVIQVGHLVAIPQTVQESSGTKILFVGADYDPNVESVVWFVENVFSKVKSRVPDSEFMIAGSVCNRIGDSQGVRKLGIVPDLDTVYSQAAVVVNCHQSGTGMSIKSIDALAAGRPFVSTTVGARGLVDAAGDAFLLCDDPETFAEAVVKFLLDADLRLEFSERARNFARDWNSRQINSLLSVIPK